MTFLRDSNHPYRCEEGNYYKNGQHIVYRSWREFAEEWDDADREMNAVFRWDWRRAEDQEEATSDTLIVHWVLQRKAILRSTECPVTLEDEPDVRKWLSGHAADTIARWSPLISS